MINQFAPQIAVFVLAAMVLLLLGMVIESARTLTAAALAALLGAARAVGVVIFVVALFALVLITMRGT